jgi:hypothetical protein
MIIHRGQIGVGPAADFPDGGLAEAPGGEDLAGGLEKALPGFRGGGGGRVFGSQFYVLSFRLKIFLGAKIKKLYVKLIFQMNV